MIITTNPKTGYFDTWAQQVTFDRRMALLEEDETSLNALLYLDGNTFSIDIVKEYLAKRKELL
jgi:hypothetical protein